jgi:UDP-N-acetylmuramoyl-L-alanyl-D-glutamate--2,6-diaminopimelate ligase
VAVDDPYGARLAAELPAAVTFGAGGAVAVARAELDERGVRGTFTTPRGPLAFASPLLGRFNLANLTAAVAGAEALGLPHAATTAAIAARGPLPGRLQPVLLPDGGRPPLPVFVDYAHTPAALAAAAAAARELARGPLVLVFGCGGDRDAGKRPEMGRIAGELADLPIVTTDNPRSEDPLAIVAAVEEGLKASGNRRYRVVPDRREAIRRAVAVAGEGGAVLIAGKGAEAVQIVGDRELPFNDYDEAVLALAERYGQAVRG